MGMRRNPHRLDLAIAQVIGWAMYFVIFGYAIWWLGWGLPFNHPWWIAGVIALAAVLQATVEDAITEHFSEWELRNHG